MFVVYEEMNMVDELVVESTGERVIVVNAKYNNKPFFIYITMRTILSQRNIGDAGSVLD